ncbi:MAG TPA: hypothetical protein VGD37_23535 [Kofleriaceae bacterium]|jgi:hypothetical protein
MVRERGYTHALLVAVSGYGNPIDKACAHDAGFDHHITKLVDAATLVRVLGGRNPSEPEDQSP